MPQKDGEKKKPRNNFFTEKAFKFLLFSLFFYFLSHAFLFILTMAFSLNSEETANVKIVSNPGLPILANQDPTRFDLNQDGVDDYIFGYGCYRLEPSQYPSLLRENYSRKNEFGFTCESESEYATGYFQTDDLVFVATKDEKTYLYRDGLFSDAKVFTESGWKPTSLPSDLFLNKTLSLSYADVKNGSYGLPWFYLPINLISNGIQSILYFFTSQLSPSLGVELVLFITIPILVDIIGILSLILLYFRVGKNVQISK